MARLIIRYGLAFLSAIFVAQFNSAIAQDHDFEGLTSAEAVELGEAAVALLSLADVKIQVSSFDDHLSGHFEKQIVLVIGDSRQSDFFPGTHNNCKADAASRIIECDTKLVDALLYGSIDPQYTDAVNLWRSNILALILAHEVGHIQLRHLGPHYHGSNGRISVLDYANHAREYAADEFAVGVFDRAKDPVETYHYIAELTQAQIRMSKCPNTFPDPCPCKGEDDPTLCHRVPSGPGLAPPDEPFPIVLLGTHPDHFVRFARMLTLTQDSVSQTMFGGVSSYLLSNVRVTDETGTAQRLSLLASSIDDVEPD